METTASVKPDYTGMCKYALCEEFADEQCLPTDYVWQEFVDPNVASLEEVCLILSNY